MARGSHGAYGSTTGSEMGAGKGSSREPHGNQQPATPAAVKRMGYMFGLGGGVFALLLGSIIEFYSGKRNLAEIVSYLFMAGLLAGLLIALMRAGRSVRRLELATFAVLSTFFLIRLGIALYLPGQTPHQITDQLSRFGFWFPTLYASLLFILGVDRGWRVSAGHFMLSLLLALPFVGDSVIAGETHALFSLSQLFVSSAVLIVTMTIFARYTERVIRANAEMEHLAHTDFITELGNRRRMERVLGQEVKRVERYGDALSLLLLDLDQFKRVNDAHGHPAGDQVLREVAALLAAESRASDHLGRWGGEEFVLILPQTERAEALELAKRIMSRVREYPFTKVGKVTVSIGGATWEIGELPRDLIKRADDALYQAKGKGRDRVVMSGPPELETASE
ncbi:MAG TPA: GGDEF domain-containing protein [Trueperaceae bacterium]